MAYIVLGVALGTAGVLSGFLIYALNSDEFEFWPPPRDRCWQDYAFWGLFRLFCVATAVVAFIDPWTFEWNHWSRIVIGAPVMAGGLGLTVYGYHFLGLDNTYGRSAGLVTRGIYAYSRNPQYITSVLGTIGLGLTFDSPIALILAAVLLGLYTLFALNEERWLYARYGEPYADYTARVPRFADHRSFARAWALLTERP